jgi:hypothetical protein
MRDEVGVAMRALVQCLQPVEIVRSMSSDQRFVARERVDRLA